MDTTLVTVTVLSMGMAAALSVIVWRLLRDERRRSDARVIALTEAAAPPDRIDRTPASPTLPVRARSAGAVPSAFRKRATIDTDLPLRPASPPAAAPALFVEAARPSPWGNRAAIMLGVALLGGAALLFALSAGNTRSERAAAAQAEPAAAEVTGPGLELLSLRDSRADGSLTITGLVHNPHTGRLMSRVAVTAYAFDEKGAFLASGRALLDVTSLAPGDDSPFVVTVPVTETVARYRIGFRAEDGRVIAHVDKRQQGPMAALW